MTLANINKMKKERGFTIVELLIVIVVIAILAAIVIVAYNGVQNKAKTTRSQSNAQEVAKKAEAYNAEVGSYPSAEADFGTDNSKTYFVPSAIDFTASNTTKPTSTNGETTVEYTKCVKTGGTLGTDPVIGAKVYYYDFSAGNSDKFATAGETGGVCDTPA